MKKILAIMILCIPCIQAGIVEVGSFKRAVKAGKLDFAAGIYAGLDNNDKKAADDWYKNNKIQGKDLPKIGFSFKAGNNANEAAKLTEIAKDLVKPAVNAVKNSNVSSQEKKDALGTFLDQVRAAVQ